MPDENHNNEPNWAVIGAGVFFIFLAAAALIALPISFKGGVGTCILLALGLGLAVGGSSKPPEPKS